VGVQDKEGFKWGKRKREQKVEYPDHYFIGNYTIPTESGKLYIPLFQLLASFFPTHLI